MTLIGYYNCEQSSDPHDLTDGRYNGSLTSVTTGAQGVLGGNAYSFDGSSSRFDASYAVYNNLGVSDNTFTISLWGNFDSVGSNTRTLVNDWHDGSSHIILRTESNSNLNFYIKQTSGSNAVETGSTALSAGQWYHIVIVARDGTAEVWLDGEEDGTGTSYTDINSGDSDFTFGSQDNGGNYFKGNMDEIRIYDHALTASEIQYLYSLVSDKDGFITQTKSFGSDIDPTSVSLKYDTTLNGESARARVLTDPGSDGTFEEKSDWVQLQNGSNTASVSGLSTAFQDVRVEVELTPSVTSTPVLNSVDVEGNPQ